ncbi:MAG: hypothetical protein JWO37_1206 [Acidimicrobiales bacterium]|nr:hypothetical protein [Acidimicrobiales bacterium]
MSRRPRGPDRQRRASALAPIGISLLFLVLSACRIGIHTGVDMHRDGSGVVRVAVSFDDDALRQVGGQLQTADLIKAGWTVDGPRKESDGLTWVRAAKPFATPAQGEQVAGEVGRKLFRDLKLERKHSLFKTRLSLRWTVDFSGGSGALSDPALEQQLAQGGADADAIRRQLVAAADRAISTEVVAHLPGKVTSNAPLTVSGGVVWTPKPGDPPSTLTASSVEWNKVPIALAATAVLLAITAPLVLFRARRRNRSRIDDKNGG